MTAYVPSNGKHVIGELPWEDQVFDLNSYTAQDGDSIYQLFWTTGPATQDSDDEFVRTFFSSVLKSMSQGFAKAGGDGYQCLPSKSTALSQGGFTGREFDLHECIIPGVARLFTQVDGQKRRVYLAFGMYRPGNPSNDAYTFVRSLKVGTSVGSAQAKK